MATNELASIGHWPVEKFQNFALYWKDSKNITQIYLEVSKKIYIHKYQTKTQVPLFLLLLLFKNVKVMGNEGVRIQKEVQLTTNKIHSKFL